jgi:hypothetical protein
VDDQSDDGFNYLYPGLICCLTDMVIKLKLPKKQNGSIFPLWTSQYIPHSLQELTYF